jgi:Xaa-Pro aminopeptidase
MDDYPGQRRERLASLLPTEGLDCWLITSTVNVTYLTGFSGDSSVLIVGRQRSVLVSDPRYTQQIEEECPGLETHIRVPSRKLYEAIADAVGKLGHRQVGFEAAAMTVAEFETLRGQLPTVSWKGTIDRVERLRMVKDPSELAEIRQAIRIAENAFTVFRTLLQPHDREKDLCDAMEGYVRRVGGIGTSFPPIIAAGERAALPHAPPTERTADSGEVLLVDWGATGARSYKSDLTRTFASRKVSARLEEVYAVVLNAQREAIRAVRPGAIARDIDAAARSAIDAAGYGEAFGHGLGHGIGLQIHEGPSIRPNSETVIEPGMIFTIEPGVYLPGWGGVRIEDDILVTPDGCEVLTSLPRELETLFA